MKAVYDTCLYVDLLRDNKRQDLFGNRSHIRFLSPIVVLELNAGVNTVAQKRGLDRLFYPYSKARRILSFESSHFYKAGEILARCRQKMAPLPRGFSHDVLLAISASSVGATLFTRDNDFAIIRKHFQFDLEMV